MLVPILILFAILALLFVVWRVRYRYPPATLPQALCYHKLSHAFCFEGTWISPQRFLGHVDHLESKGYRFIDEEAFLSALNGTGTPAERKLLLTFDDGYRELHDVYLRYLKPRGIAVLVFLVSGYMGKENAWEIPLGRRPFRHLAWSEARELASQGVTFGSHGVSHADLTMLDDEQLRAEVVDSKNAIEDTLGVAVRSFSYPYGRCDDRAKAAVADAGYAAAFSLYPSHSNERVDRWSLRRNAVYVIDTRRCVERKLQPSPLYWLEEMKCRSINGVAVVTPFVKRLAADPDK